MQVLIAKWKSPLQGRVRGQSREMIFMRKLRVALWVFVCAMLCPRSMGAEVRRPNLVFVMSDQQSFDMLGCYGNKQILTPQLNAFKGDPFKESGGR